MHTHTTDNTTNNNHANNTVTNDRRPAPREHRDSLRGANNSKYKQMKYTIHNNTNSNNNDNTIANNSNNNNDDSKLNQIARDNRQVLCEAPRRLTLRV